MTDVGWHKFVNLMKNLQYVALTIKIVCFFKKIVYNADNGGGWEEFTASKTDFLINSVFGEGFVPIFTRKKR